MINRVTSQTRMVAAQRNLQSAAAQLAKLQDTGTSLKKIAAPSDDPTGTADSMRVRAAQSAAAQFGRNIDDGEGWISTVDSSLSSATDILNKVRDLTVQGANDGSMSPTAKQAIEKELVSLRDNLRATANTTYLGRTVFAGNSDTGVAFTPGPAYGFTGDANPVLRRVDGNQTVRVDADGAATFGVGAASVFALIDNIVTDLQSGVNVGPRLAAIDTALTAMQSQHSTVGANQAQIEKAKATNLQTSGALEAQRSGIEDVDISEIVIQLKQQEVSYQAALAITSRTLQPTLMDYLK